MRNASPREPLVCPPYVSLAASNRGEALRPTAKRRPLYLVVIARNCPQGYLPTDPYVRRFWSAVVGAEAVADLLRIVQAGHRGNSIRRPVHLSTLLSAGLVHVEGRLIVVRERVPALPRRAVDRLPPALRQGHRDWIRLTPPDGAPASDQKRGQLARNKAPRNPEIRASA